MGKEDTDRVRLQLAGMRLGQLSKAEGAASMPEIPAVFKLLGRVREPSEEDRRILREILGRDSVILNTESKSLETVVGEYPLHFWSGQMKDLGDKPDLASYVPPAMTIALNPKKLFIPDTFYKSHAAQSELTEAYSISEIELRLPQARVIMLPASVLAQADIKYRLLTGNDLFTNSYGRALDSNPDLESVDVGRFRPGSKLAVSESDASGSPFVGAVRAIVLLRDAAQTQTKVTQLSHSPQRRSGRRV